MQKQLSVFAALALATGLASAATPAGEGFGPQATAPVPAAVQGASTGGVAAAAPVAGEGFRADATATPAARATDRAARAERAAGPQRGSSVAPDLRTATFYVG